MNKRGLGVLFVCLVLIAGMLQAQSSGNCSQRLSTKSSASDLIFCLREIGSDFALAREEISQLRLDLARTKELIIPSNAVLVVDDPRGCPGGWVEFSRANGRVVIGATSPNTSGSLQSVSGAALQRKFGEFGGEETVTLNVPQMPSHWHNVIQPNGKQLAVSNHSYQPGSNRVSLLDNGGVSTLDYRTDPTGGDQPHNNMPPYIALYFCKKN